MEQYTRTEMLFGKEGMEILRGSRVAVFGIGGVGGYAVEALARSGIGTLDLIDHDKVSLSNLNRQIIATHRTLGQYKVDAAASRIRDIDPEIRVNPFRCFFSPEISGDFDFSRYDYVIDAIDTVQGKLEIIQCAKEAGIPVISSMSAGNKLDPSAFRVADIFSTRVCPLARVMRAELRKRGIRDVKVVYSEEKARRPAGKPEKASERPPGKPVPGSNSFVPPAAGLILAGEVIKDLLRDVLLENE